MGVLTTKEERSTRRGQLPAALLAEYTLWRAADGRSFVGTPRADRPDPTKPRTVLRVALAEVLTSRDDVLCKELAS